ncbi:Solute carrier family 35 member E2 [Galdieria sulphuraria]|uniref:Small multidrug efflux protein, DMT family n=1 Tax=Galdieria sulphuraria TaxID=130081 RepID=M2Y878_GALSU|nr:small multidrug efflux protein, DMT family [Galdieria sulphuraria]EME32273.1 small multidrug efflux protein, DMT family [Galdieria sulphuraria]GJD09704.1 Solute carrier family 35 member E2 [Galdieria sulphuraria]|eukprot:XP_005708793.1 small multidrug efflux protein, DMT family [Galdieria sulphuraria]
MSWIRKSRLLILYSFWVFISVGNLFLTKWILSDRQVPESFLIFGQLFVSLLLSLLSSTSESKDVLCNVNILKELVILSLFSTLIYLFKYVGLSRISLTLAVTLRCASPIFQVATQYIVFGDRFSLRALTSLVPIFVGLVLASFAESKVTVEVENIETKNSILLGSFASILSTLVGVFHSLFAKSMLSKQLSPLTIQTYQSGIGCLLILPLILYNWKFFNEMKSWELITIVIFKGSLSFVQLHVALKVLEKMSTVGFSIAGSTRRVLTCILSLLLNYESSLGFIHWLGTFISLAGILLYDSAQKTNHSFKSKMDDQVLMTVNSDCSLYSRDINENEFLERK